MENIQENATPVTTEKKSKLTPEEIKANRAAAARRTL